MTVSYRKRQNAFIKHEQEWRIEDDAFVAIGPDGRQERHPWPTLKAARLGYAPTRLRTGRYVLVLDFPKGQRITVDNLHWHGVGNFEDRSLAYRSFVTAAMQKIAQKTPQLRVRLGSSPFSYVLQLAFVAVCFVFLGLTMIFLTGPQDWSWLSWMRFSIIVAMMPVFFLWIKRARPRMAAPDALPPDALPEVPPPEAAA